MSGVLLGNGMRRMRKEVMAGLCMGAAWQTSFHPAFGAADRCRLQLGCEGEAAPAASTGERTGTGSAVGFVRGDG